MSKLLRVAVVFALAAAVAACSDGNGPGITGKPRDGNGAAAELPICDDEARVSAPADWYRDEPVYVGNEMPTEDVKAWAETKPGFVDIWIDRDHNGWVTAAFTEQVDERQAELEREFPGAGVVAVHVDWTADELEDLERRVNEALRPKGWDISIGSRVSTGVVTVGLGVLSPERLDALDQFRGERICVSGADPATAVADGPQPKSGDGWRLLGEDLVGDVYRTGVATNQAQYEALWSTAELTTDPPHVDFETEIVVWFGAVYGSSCPIRLDDVEIDLDQALLYGDFVIPGNPSSCNDDANPHAYVVAVLRSSLPSGPFAVQLGPDDPPRGVPEERTLVAVDLSAPGSIATADQLGTDPSLLPENRPSTVESGAIIEPGYPANLKLPARCGVRVLGILNSVLWETDEIAESGELPPEWQAIVDDSGDLTLEVNITIEGPTAVASANGRTVTYRPSTGDRDTCS